MSKSFLIMSGLALLATTVAWRKGPEVAMAGATGATKMFLSVLPSMLVGFLLGGMVQVLLPRDLVAAYAGEDSGLMGLVIAAVVGAFTPGGPFVAFPLVASLWNAGTGVGPLVSFLTSWSLLGFHRILIYEGPIMGMRFTLVRIASVIFVPILTGFIAAWLYRITGGGQG